MRFHGKELLRIYNRFAEKGLKAFEAADYGNDSEKLLDQLLEIHFVNVEIFCLACKEFCKSYPDIHPLLARFSNELKFHRQLFLNRNEQIYNLAFLKGVSDIKNIMLPLFMKHYKYDDSFQSLEAMWATLVESWFARLDINDLSAETMQGLTDEIMKVMQEFHNAMMNCST